MLIAHLVGSAVAFVAAAATWILHRRDVGGVLMTLSGVALGVWFLVLGVGEQVFFAPDVNDPDMLLFRLLSGIVLLCALIVCSCFLGLTLNAGARGTPALLRTLGLFVTVEAAIVVVLSSPGQPVDWFGEVVDGAFVPARLFALHAAFCLVLVLVGLCALMTRWDSFDRSMRRRCVMMFVLVVGIVANEVGQHGLTPFLALVLFALTYISQFRHGWDRQVHLGSALVADQLSDPMIIVDNDGDVVDANHQGRELLETGESPSSIEELLGAGFRLDDQHDALVTVSRSTSRVDMIVRSTRVVQGGELLGWAVTLRDIDSMVYRQNDPVGDYQMLRRRRTDKRTGSDNLAVLMRHDPLTAASTRIAFEGVLEAAVASSRTSGHRVQVMMIDIDRFKGINDKHGHLVGDAILREVVDRVAQFIEIGEMVARYGGDEFVLLLRRDSDDLARRAAEDMCLAVSAEPIVDSLDVDVTVSIGVAGFVADAAQTGASLLAEADQAMYRVKRAGGNGVSFGEGAVRRN